MCPTNDKSTLCSHATASLPALFPPRTATPPPPLQLFCRDVVASAIIALLDAAAPSAVAPDAPLAATLSSMAPGAALPALLCACRVFEPMYLNGPEVFLATSACFVAGVRDWVGALVDDGVLRRRGRAQVRGRGWGQGGRENYAEEAAAEEWEWDWLVVEEWRRDEAVLRRWVWDKIWREGRARVIMNLLPRVPLGTFFDWSSLSAADRALVEELRILRPDWPGVSPPPGERNRQPPAWDDRQQPVRGSFQQQQQQQQRRGEPERRRPSEPRTPEELQDHLSRRAFRHRQRAHRYDSKMDELARIQAKRETNDRMEQMVAEEDEGE